jgi:3-keto-disaccharide hydrolase
MSYIKRQTAASRVCRAGTLAACLIVGLISADYAAAHCGMCEGDKTQHNTLTDQEEAEGWDLLFDGETFEWWRGYKQDDMPEGWAIEDGCIVRVGGGGDIITREDFDDFELSLEWKIEEGGNSGIFYNVVEDYDNAWESAPEMQVLDNGTHNDGKATLTSAGANYGLIAPSQDVTKPIGEFNHVLIRIVGNHVEHHLNGHKLLEYELGSEAWQALVDASKFKDMPGYGKSPVGHIALQDHGDKVYYRNLKIRRLDEQETE